VVLYFSHLTLFFFLLLNDIVVGLALSLPSIPLARANQPTNHPHISPQIPVITLSLSLAPFLLPFIRSKTTSREREKEREMGLNRDYQRDLPCGVDSYKKVSGHYLRLLSLGINEGNWHQ
jgi:hypothetical protein